VFGYTNTTGANVTLGTGPHNFFSPGLADAGQPILFLPGQVPIATFETFAAGSHLSYTIGQQTALAMQNSPACPAALASGLKQLYVASPASDAVKQSIASLMANPRFGALISKFRAAGNVFTPFESSMLDALQFVIANAYSGHRDHPDRSIVIAEIGAS
jgi:hypothetical protein